MRLEVFPFCCTAHVLVDLGGTDTAEDGYTEYTEQQFQALLTEKVQDAKRSGDAIVVATTTTDQEQANQMLKDNGFNCVGPYAKNAHPESGLYLWWLPLKGMYGEEG